MGGRIDTRTLSVTANAVPPLPKGEALAKTGTNILRKYRLQVLRFPNNAVDKNFEGVCQVIHQTVQERLGVNPDDLWVEE